MNSSKGVIKCRDLAGCDDAEIIKELEAYGVTHVLNMKIKHDSVLRPTSTYVLTFDAPKPPKTIRVGYKNVAVELYIPNPMRCFNCQKYGHGSRSCKSKKVCAKCAGTDHDDKDCQSDFKCARCQGPHPVYSKECPVWLQEKKIQHTKVSRDVTFAQAKKVVLSSEPAPPKRNNLPKISYARAVVDSSQSLPVTGSPRSSLMKTSSVQTQTELTWPLSLGEPVYLISNDKGCQTDFDFPEVIDTSSQLSFYKKGAAQSSMEIDISHTKQSLSTSVSETKSRTRGRTKLVRPVKIPGDSVGNPIKNPVTTSNIYHVLADNNTDNNTEDENFFELDNG